MIRKIAILCDFDGTVAQDDVGNLLFSTFADPAVTGRIVDEWKDGSISSRECLEREAAATSVAREELNRFIGQRRLDPYFKDFIDFTRRRRNMEVIIVSDGLDHYVEKMLIGSGLGDLEFYANVLRFVAGGLRVGFPYYDRRDCIDCGNCKTHHLQKYRDAGCYIVYVGNGLSDRCPSGYADLVFAKGELLDYCELNGVGCVEFKNFRDVERELLQRFVLDDEAELGESVGGL